MMAVIFALLLATMLVGWFGSRRLAIVLVILTLALSTHLFLWEIRSSDYGYAMPWIRT